MKWQVFCTYFLDNKYTNVKAQKIFYNAFTFALRILNDKAPQNQRKYTNGKVSSSTLNFNKNGLMDINYIDVNITSQYYNTIVKIKNVNRKLSFYNVIREIGVVNL